MLLRKQNLLKIALIKLQKVLMRPLLVKKTQQLMPMNMPKVNKRDKVNARQMFKMKQVKRAQKKQKNNQILVSQNIKL